MEINSRNENIELNNIINNLDLNENNEEIDISIIEDNIDVLTETNEYLETEFNVFPMTSETDPIFLSSPAHNIRNSDIENWNSKQERLTPGDNITIENNVISSTATGGTGNFDELDNRPKYNNNVMNHLTNIPLVPTKISDLENDSEFITKNVNNLVNYTKSSLLGTLALKDNVNYNTEVTNKPTIPTKTSDLTNDSGFITEHQDLSNYPTLDGLNIFSNAQKILSNAYAGLSLYYDTDNYVNFGYTGFHYNTNGESGTIDYKDIGGGGVSPSDLLNYIYPVGSVYLSVNNVSPQTFLGGTWVRFAKGRALVGVDENDSSINTSLKEVGSSLLQQHNHSYTTNNPGDHTHRGRYRGGALGQYYFLRRINSADGYDGEDQVTYGAGGHTHSGTTGNSGAGNSNNIPPEISIYCWRRTA